MFHDNHLHIAVASDENYARFVASLIVSVIDSNSGDFERITFHLLSNNISSAALQKIRSHVDGSQSELHVYDISNLDTCLGIEVPPTIALTAYARLFLNRLIPNAVSRILYLDTDIIVVGSLLELWRSELKNYYIGGCLDVFEGTASKTNIGLAATAPYINSGVLLINLDKWRSDRLDIRFMDFLKAQDGHVHHHDQGIINAVCKDKLLLLPPQYNMHSTVFSHSYELIKRITNPYYTLSEFNNAHANPRIIHFTEGFYNRPWKQHCKHPYRNAYTKYAVKTAWRDEPLLRDDRSMAVKLLSHTFLSLPYPCYKALSRLLGTLKNLIR